MRDERIFRTATAALLVRLPKVESGLIEQFGDEYRDYMERTGLLLPRLR